MAKRLKIGVVGACGTGKSELVTRLNQHGYRASHIAQEHSYAPRMWKQLSNPDILVFLKVSYSMTLKRKNFDWSEKEYQEQIHRLRHAKNHADLEIDTDHLTLDEVFEAILAAIVGIEY
jgi:deoxyadenosine/deoxycytidine kinase